MLPRKTQAAVNGMSLGFVGRAQPTIYAQTKDSKGKKTQEWNATTTTVERSSDSNLIRDRRWGLSPNNLCSYREEVSQVMARPYVASDRAPDLAIPSSNGVCRARCVADSFCYAKARLVDHGTRQCGSVLELRQVRRARPSIHCGQCCPASDVARLFDSPEGSNGHFHALMGFATTDVNKIAVLRPLAGLSLPQTYLAA